MTARQQSLVRMVKVSQEPEDESNERVRRLRIQRVPEVALTNSFMTDLLSAIKNKGS